MGGFVGVRISRRYETEETDVVGWVAVPVASD